MKCDSLVVSYLYQIHITLILQVIEFLSLHNLWRTKLEILASNCELEISTFMRCKQSWNRLETVPISLMHASLEIGINLAAVFCSSEI